MTDQIIIEYLRNNKRLVVPDLGTFIRKDAGEIVFVEFMKKDDGVLTALVQSKSGSSNDKAIADIKSYATNVKRAIASDGEYIINGLGRIYKTQEGMLEFDLNLSGPRPGESLDLSPTRSTPPQPKGVSAPPVTKKELPTVVTHIAQPKKEERPVRAERAAADILFDPSLTNQYNSSPSGEKAPEPRKTTASHKNGTLSTGNPTYSAATGSQRTTYQEASAARPRPRLSGPAPKQKKTDMVMIFAIAAAVIALIALAYNMLGSSSPIKNMRSTNYLEQPLTPAPDDDIRASINEQEQN